MGQTMRHARLPRRAARSVSSVAVLSATLLVVALAGPANAAPGDPASSQAAVEQDPPAAEGSGGADAEPAHFALTVAVTDTSGAAVPGVRFELWQETNGSAGLQQSGDSDTGAACTTAVAGSCTAGMDEGGVPQLTAGTYYWLQTGTPEGYQAPAAAGEPVGTVTISEAAAGTVRPPTAITLARVTEDADPIVVEHGDGGAGRHAAGDSTDDADDTYPDGVEPTDDSGSAGAEPDDEGWADVGATGAGAEGAGPPDSGPTGTDPADVGSEAAGGAAGTTTAQHDEDQDLVTVDSPLVAQHLSPRSAASGSVQIGQIQARLSDQTSSGGSDDCLTYDPATSGDSTRWVANSEEARAGHGSTWRECSFDGDEQSVLGVTPAVVTSVDPGVSFLLGQTTHYNNPIRASGEYFSGSLSLRMSNVPGVEFRVPWQIWETDNDGRGGWCADGGWNYWGINDNGCADRITFISQVADQTVEIDGVTYTLVLDGFSPATGVCPASRPSNTQNVFWTREADTTSACVYGTLVQVRNLTIVKDLSAPDATAPAFTFSATSSLDGADWDGPSFSLDPNGTDRRSGGVTQGERVTITETAIPDGWSLQDVTCVGLSASDISVSGSTLTIADVPVAGAGDTDIVCTFTNTRLTPDIQVVKHAWDSAGHENEITSGSPVIGGTTVYWTYQVTNTGAVPLHGITVTDDQVGQVSCPTDTLPSNGQMTCTASGVVTALAAAP